METKRQKKGGMEDGHQIMHSSIIIFQFCFFVLYVICQVGSRKKLLIISY